jgi:hypothetical protein
LFWNFLNLRRGLTIFLFRKGMLVSGLIFFVFALAEKIIPIVLEITY